MPLSKTMVKLRNGFRKPLATCLNTSRYLLEMPPLATTVKLTNFFRKKLYTVLNKGRGAF